MQVGGIFKHYDPEALKAAKDSGGYAPDFSPTAAKRNQELSDAMYSEWSKKVNIMVLTAAIPGRPPPALVSKAMVNEMLPGSVIVDLAASDQWAKDYTEACKNNGGVPPAGTSWPGNCEYTMPGSATVTDNGVKIIGYTDLPSRFGGQATDFYANNLVNLLEDMCAKGSKATRGDGEPVLGDARDFKIDMHVVREQTDELHESYSRGEFAPGDDIMSGMCMVKVEEEGGKMVARLDHPKKRKPMETAQAAIAPALLLA